MGQIFIRLSIIDLINLVVNDFEANVEKSIETTLITLSHAYNIKDTRTIRHLKVLFP